MPDFFARLDQMVEALRKTTWIEVQDYTLFPPLTPAQQKDIETFLEAPLDPTLATFYTHANGLRLHWRIQPSLKEAEVEQLQERSEDYGIELPEAEENPFARIELLPLDQTLLKTDWPSLLGYDLEDDTPLKFAKKTHTYADLARLFKPFDRFSDYACMAFLAEPGSGNPKVVWLTDYYIDWNSSRITDFASYLEFLLLTRGICEARETVFYEYEGYKKKPLVWGKNYPKPSKLTPMLFR